MIIRGLPLAYFQETQGKTLYIGTDIVIMPRQDIISASLVSVYSFKTLTIVSIRCVDSQHLTLRIQQKFFDMKKE